MKLLALAIDVLNGTALSRLSELKMTAKSFAVIGVFCSISAIFLLIAIVIALSEWVGVIYACLIMSGVFAFAALVTFALRRRVHKHERISAKQQAAAIAAAEARGKSDVVILAEAFIKGFMNPRP